MSRLSIYDEKRAGAPLSVHTAHADIARELGRVGVRFEQWEAAQPIAPGASQEDVIAAYRSDIDRLMRDEGYQAVDVISLKPDNPDRAAFRRKFLNEHTHSEDEVRFFVAGA
ncbi:MAG TPA: cupin, partial [Rhodanobacteraceae bacterium]|nr:cupin [Rhodanobacteraceae bacterium]